MYLVFQNCKEKIRFQKYTSQESPSNTQQLIQMVKKMIILKTQEL